MNMLKVKTKSPTAIEHVRELLSRDHPYDALKFIEHLGQKTPVMENARGVCLMRLGKIEEAVSVLRDIAFQGYICIPTDTPALYQINFATAMLLSKQNDSAFDILNKLDEKVHPEASKLKEAIRRWVKVLNFIEKCAYYIGLYPNKRVTIDFPPGEV
jgi:hypothetical protein